MNVDLEKVLEVAQERFPDAVISSNVVEFTKPELSWEDLNHLSQVVIDCPRSRPWVFRSGKGVKVVIFIKTSVDHYLTGETNIPSGFPVE